MAKLRTQEVIEGFDDLVRELQNYAKAADSKTTEKALETGAEALTEKLNKLPYPISQIRKAGYSHLVREFYYGKPESGKYKGQIEVGWGKYYGPMVERGTKQQNAQAHLEPTWEREKDKIYKLMVDVIGIE